MKVSRKTRYALRAMLELAAHYKEGTLSAKSVSQKQDIPFSIWSRYSIGLKGQALSRRSAGRKVGIPCHVRPQR